MGPLNIFFSFLSNLRNMSYPYEFGGKIDDWAMGMFGYITKLIEN